MWKLNAVLIMIVASLALAAPTLAESESFSPKVTDVTVFKNGYALALTRTEAQFENGWCRTNETPSPVLGTFWAYVADDKAKVDYIKAEMVEVSEEKPCLSLTEIIQANKGKKALVIEQAGSTDPVEHQGVLLGFLEHKATKRRPNRERAEHSQRGPARGSIRLPKVRLHARKGRAGYRRALRGRCALPRYLHLGNPLTASARTLATCQLRSTTPIGPGALGRKGNA